MTASATSPVSPGANTRSGCATAGQPACWRSLPWTASMSSPAARRRRRRAATCSTRGHSSRSTAGARAWTRSRRSISPPCPTRMRRAPGRPDNVGVIGVALFRESPRPMPMEGEYAGAAPKPLRRRRRLRTARAPRSRLGTGHGRRLDSGAVYTHLRAREREPDEIIRIYYDSRKNLVARGIIPRPHDRFAGSSPTRSRRPSSPILDTFEGDAHLSMPV